MDIYNRDLEGTNEIFQAVKEIMEDDRLGNQIDIVRMYSAAKREYESMQLRNKFVEKSGKKYVNDVIIIDDKSAIVISQKDKNIELGLWYQPVILSNYQTCLYETLDEALIGLVCIKTNNMDASRWIGKMLGIET